MVLASVYLGLLHVRHPFRVRHPKWDSKSHNSSHTSTRLPQSRTCLITLRCTACDDAVCRGSRGADPKANLLLPRARVPKSPRRARSRRLWPLSRRSSFRSSTRSECPHPYPNLINIPNPNVPSRRRIGIVQWTNFGGIHLQKQIETSKPSKTIGDDVDFTPSLVVPCCHDKGYTPNPPADCMPGIAQLADLRSNESQA